MKQVSVTLSKIMLPLLSDIIPRKRLFRLIDAGRKRPIIWICGPPGSGKTTLAASYIIERKVPYLWYRMDEGDDDAGSFFYYLGLAAKKAAPRSRLQLPLLSPENLLALPIFARRYFQNLYGRLKIPSVIVFDNYHDIPPGSQLHKVIHDGLAEVPSGINIIFTSRYDPPPSLADFRSKGMLEIIPWNSLKLTNKETEAIVKIHRKGLKLSGDSINTLHRKSAGWVAGLLLLLKEGEKQKHSSINIETPEVVFDYLAGEVFERIDNQTRIFLLKTAFIPVMTARMAEGLTGIPESGRILTYLHNSNLFTEKSPDAESSYQYHPLFREFLFSRVKRHFTGDAIALIQKDAAMILESAGQAENALGLYTNAGDWGNAIRLICIQAPSLIVQGRSETISSWLSRLPQELIDQTPWLLYWKGVCSLLVNPEDGLPCFERAFPIFIEADDAAGVFLTWCGVIDSIFYTFRDFSRLDPWIDKLTRIRIRHLLFPSEEIETRVTSTMLRSLLFRNPTHPEFHEWAERAIHLFQRNRDMISRMEYVFHLVFYCHLMGDFSRAAILIQSIEGSKQFLPETTPPIALLGWHSTRAFYYWLTGSIDKCLEVVSEGLKVSGDTGVHRLDYVLLGQGIAGALSGGDLATAGKLLIKMSSCLDMGGHNDRAFYHFVAGWEALLKKNLPLALQHAIESLKQAEELGGEWQKIPTRILMAQVFHEQGEYRKAKAYLSNTYRFARDSKSLLFEYMCLLLKAQFAMDKEDENTCLDSLRKAMTIGREKGLLNFWGWRPDVMAKLCAKAIEANIEVEYVQRLIQERRLTMDPPPLHISNWPWPIKIHTLGRFEVEKDGIPIQVTAKGHRKPFEMLKVIIALGGQKVREWQISEALWPEADKETYSALTTLISRLRSFIGHEAIIQKQGHVTLNPQICYVDIRALEQLLHDAEKTGQSDQSDQADPVHESLTESILNLYQGPFLKEDEMSWAYSVRERLASKFIRYLRKRGRCLEQKGDYEQAITLHQRGLETDPVSEGHYRCLMACHHALGRRAEAIAVYERCRKALSTLRHGVEPSRETEALYQKIRGAGEP